MIPTRHTLTDRPLLYVEKNFGSTFPELFIYFFLVDLAMFFILVNTVCVCSGYIHLTHPVREFSWTYKSDLHLAALMQPGDECDVDRRRLTAKNPPHPRRDYPRFYLLILLFEPMTAVIYLSGRDGTCRLLLPTVIARICHQGTRLCRIELLNYADGKAIVNKHSSSACLVLFCFWTTLDGGSVFIAILACKFLHGIHAWWNLLWKWFKLRLFLGLLVDRIVPGETNFEFPAETGNWSWRGIMKNWIATEWFFSSVYFSSIVSISSIATIFNFHWYNDPALPSVSWNCEWKTGIGRIHSSPRFSPVELLFLLRDGVGVATREWEGSSAIFPHEFLDDDVKICSDERRS